MLITVAQCTDQGCVQYR